MPTTPRLNWPYPAEFSEHWFPKWISFVTAVDASFFSTREDKNFVLFGGGTVSFNATTGVLSWSSPLQAVSAVTGIRWYIPTPLAGGTVTLQDGEFFYVSLTRAPTATQSIAPQSGSKIPVSDDAIVLGQRLGGAVIFRNGAVVGDGQSIVLFGPRTFSTVFDVVGIAGLQGTAAVGWEDRGGLRYEPSLYFPGGVGLTRQIRFHALLWTTDDVTPLAAQCRLFDITNGNPVTASEVSSTSLDPEMVSSGLLTPGLGGFPTGTADYSVQIKLDDTFGAPLPADQIFCVQAFLRTTWV